jgi:hypothetical protein
MSVCHNHPPHLVFTAVVHYYTPVGQFF